MRLSDSTLEWLVDTRRAVDQATSARLPNPGKRLTSSFLYEDHPAKSEARRAVSIACIPFDQQWAQRLQPLATKAHTHRLLYFATCHALQGLQPLYLIPNTPANAARITAQALLICSLYELATWLGEVPWGKAGKVSEWGQPLPFSDPQHPEFGAYLLRELKLAKKAGILPLAPSIYL